MVETERTVSMKFNNKRINVSIYRKEDGSLHRVDVDGPLTVKERLSFKAVLDKLNGILANPVHSRNTVLRALDHVINVEPDVLYFVQYNIVRHVL